MFCIHRSLCRLAATCMQRCQFWFGCHLLFGFLLYVLIYLLAYLRAYLLACLPAHLFTCLLACLLACYLSWNSFICYFTWSKMEGMSVYCFSSYGIQHHALRKHLHSLRKRPNNVQVKQKYKSSMKIPKCIQGGKVMYTLSFYIWTSQVLRFVA